MRPNLVRTSVVAVVACSGLALAAEVKIGTALSSGIRIDNQTGLTCRDLNCLDGGSPYSFSSLSTLKSVALAPVSPSNFTNLLSSAAQFVKPAATLTTSVQPAAVIASTDSFTLSNGIIMGQLATTSDSATPSQNPVTSESKYSNLMPPAFTVYATNAMSNFTPVFPIFLLDSFGLPPTSKAMSQQNATSADIAPTFLDLSPAPPAGSIDLPTPNTTPPESSFNVQSPAGFSGDPTVTGAGGTLDTTSTPEPSTVLLMGAGLIAVSVFARARRQVR